MVAAIPLLVAALQGDGEMLIVSALCVTLLLVAIAVYGFIRVGVVWHSMQTLLQEGEHTSGVKKNRRAIAFFFHSVLAGGHSGFPDSCRSGWRLVEHAAFLACGGNSLRRGDGGHGGGCPAEVIKSSG